MSHRILRVKMVGGSGMAPDGRGSLRSHNRKKKRGSDAGQGRPDAAEKSREAVGRPVDQGGAGMVRNTILMTCFIFVVGGCASDGNKMESSGGSSSTSGGGAAVSSPTTSGGVVADSGSMSSSQAAFESSSINEPNTSKNRIAAGVEEETLDTCLARIPQDSTTGQKMLAEQTCRRDFAPRR